MRYHVISHLSVLSNRANSESKYVYLAGSTRRGCSHSKYPPPPMPELYAAMTPTQRDPAMILDGHDPFQLSCSRYIIANKLTC